MRAKVFCARGMFRHSCDCGAVHRSGQRQQLSWRCFQSQPEDARRGEITQLLQAQDKTRLLNLSQLLGQRRDPLRFNRAEKAQGEMQIFCFHDLPRSIHSVNRPQSLLQQTDLAAHFRRRPEANKEPFMIAI